MWLLLLLGGCFCISQIYTLSVSVNYIDDLPINIMETINDTVKKMAHSIVLKSYERNLTHLSRREACASKWVYGPNKGKCGGVAKNYEDLCGEAHIPVEHLDGLEIYNLKDMEPQASSLPRGFGFPQAIEFVLYVTVRSNLQCLLMDAYASVCREGTYLVGKSVSGRPLAGAINLCPDALMGFSEIELRRTITHEFVHLLGFNYGSSQHFIRCHRMQQCENNPDCHKTLVYDDYADIHCYKRSNVIIVNDRGELEVGSPNVLRAMALKDKKNAESIGKNIICDVFDESFLEDGEEDQGPLLASTQSGVHWASNNFVSSIMAPSFSLHSQVQVDLMTVALLLDSGWYCINLPELCKLNLILNNVEDLNNTSLFGCHTQMSEEKLLDTSNAKLTDISGTEEPEETSEVEFQFTTEVFFDKDIKEKDMKQNEARFGTDVRQGEQSSYGTSSSNKLNIHPFFLLVLMLCFGPHYLLHGEGLHLVQQY